jgi:hypothetical protein
MSTGLSSILPQQAVVVFRTRRCSGVPSDVWPSLYTSTVPINQGNQAGFVGSKIFHDTALALYNPPGSNPTNKSSLDDLAQQIASDWYNWISQQYDIVYDGIAAPDAIGLNDVIEFSYRKTDVKTRVSTHPYNIDPEELMHADPANAVCVDSGTLVVTKEPFIEAFVPGLTQPSATSCTTFSLAKALVGIVDGRLQENYIGYDTVANCCTAQICVTAGVCTTGSQFISIYPDQPNIPIFIVSGSHIVASGATNTSGFYCTPTGVITGGSFRAVAEGPCGSATSTTFSVPCPGTAGEMLSIPGPILTGTLTACGGKPVNGGLWPNLVSPPINIYNSLGKLVASARISTGGTFSVCLPAFDNYTVKFHDTQLTNQCYQDNQTSIVISGCNTSVSMALSSVLYSLTFGVIACCGRSLGFPGANVQVTSLDGCSSFSGITDNNGNFTVTDGMCATCDYTITVSERRIQTWTSSYTQPCSDNEFNAPCNNHTGGNPIILATGFTCLSSLCLSPEFDFCGVYPIPINLNAMDGCSAFTMFGQFDALGLNYITSWIGCSICSGDFQIASLNGICGDPFKIPGSCFSYTIQCFGDGEAEGIQTYPACGPPPYIQTSGVCVVQGCWASPFQPGFLQGDNVITTIECNPVNYIITFGGDVPSTLIATE